MSVEPPTITCSTTEAMYLAELLGAKALVGIQDPYLGWLHDDVVKTWAQTCQSLADRHYLQIQADGRIILDLGVAAMVGAWAFPERSFLLTFTARRGPASSRYFHVSRHMVVELAVLAGGLCHLTSLANTLQVYQRVSELLGLEQQPPGPGVQFAVPESQFRQAHIQATEQSPDAGSEALQQAGIEPESATALAQALAQPLASGTLAPVNGRQGDREAGSIGLIEGEPGLWRLRSFAQGDETWIEVSPCSAEQVREDIRRIIARRLLATQPPSSEAGQPEIPQRTVIVKRKGENRLRDLQVPADISAASLADLIARILSWENDATSQTVHYQIEVHPLGRVLRPDESLASAGIRDGAWLVLQPAPSPAIQVSLGVEANRPQPDRLAGFVWKQLDE